MKKRGETRESRARAARPALTLLVIKQLHFSGAVCEARKVCHNGGIVQGV